MPALYSVALTNAGDVAVANDVLIHFPNAASRNEVIDRICARRGYNAITDGTKAQFTMNVLKTFLNDELRASIKSDYQTTADANTATDAAAKLA